MALFMQISYIKYQTISVYASLERPSPTEADWVKGEDLASFQTIQK